MADDEERRSRTTETRTTETRSSGSLFCECGAGACLLVTSKSAANPGRLYYRCPSVNRGCGFFKWQDQVLPGQLVFNIPYCGCGAGTCRLDTKTKCFVCPIKKGQGACNFLMWLDTQSSNAATGVRVDKCANKDLDEQDVPTTNLNLEKEESFVHTSRCTRNAVPTSTLSKRDNKVMLDESKGSDDEHPTRKHYKRLRLGDSKIDGSPSGSSAARRRKPLASSSVCLVNKDSQDTSPTFEMAGSGRRIFPENTLTASKGFLFSHPPSSVLASISKGFEGTGWIASAIRQNLCLEIKGWWGRLAFPPPKSLKEQSAEPSSCCDLPSFDLVLVPSNVNALSDGVSVAPVASPSSTASRQSNMPTLNEGAQHLATQGNSTMRKLASKAFVKAAEQLQSDLINLLRSLDIQDHEIMVKEADATFDALDQLQIEHEKYSQQVKEYIRCASSLAKIEQSVVISDHSSRALADRYSYEKLKLDENNAAYASAILALSVSKKHAASLAEEISNLNDKLVRTQAELSCCTAESTALEARVLGISEDKEILEKSFQTTCEQLKDARKLHMQREAERRAAKAAFQNAEVVIWG